MIRQKAPRFSPPNALRLAALTLVVGVVLAGAWFVASDFVRRVEELASARTDSVQWTLSQVEVEYLILDHALQYAENDGAIALPELRRQFDIFYSRIDTLRTSPLFADLRADAEFAPDLDTVWNTITENIALIDGTDEELLASAAELEQRFEQIHPNIRSIGLHGITFFAQQSDATREGIAATLKRVALITLVLVCVLLAMVFVLWRSFTVSKSHAQDARLSGERMSAVVSTALDAVVVSDRTGRIIEFNGGAEEIFGYRRDEALYRTIGELIVPEAMREAHFAGMKRYLETGERRVIGKGRIKLEALRKDGSIFPVEFSVSSTTRSNGEEILVSFLRDISGRVKTEQELLKARDTALAGERAKDKLLAVMSHEMRTPLNGMLGTLELLEDTGLNDRQRKYLSVINKSGQLLLHHVNDVLDIARLDSGAMEVNRRVVDLNTIIREVVDSQMTLAEQAGNRLGVTYLPEGTSRVMGDPMRLRQVLLNLVGNAVKFTHEGTIHVTAERLGGGDDVEISVTDTGIGIAPEDLDRVFNDFVTLDTTYGRETAGTGLGLGIAQRMVLAMSGDIGVESEPGDGSLFWIRLPLPPAPADAPTDDLPAIGRNILIDDVSSLRTENGDALKVLVVEDNEINRLVAREMLERSGHMVTVAIDGQQGADAARTTAFDLILMDISMPRMDGLEATRRIRSEGGASAEVPIVALTAHALSDEITRFRDAGMDLTITKPLSRAALRKALDLVNGSTPTENNGPQPELSTGVLDRDQLQAMIDDLGEARTRNLVDAFLSEADAVIARLTDPLAAPLSDPDLLKRIHKLAGSAAMFGAQGLHQWLSDAETQAKAGEMGALRARMNEVSPIWHATRDRYRNMETDAAPE